MELHQSSFKALGGMNSIQLFADDRERADDCAREIIGGVLELETKYSRYLPESVVSRINSAAGTGQSIPVDDETAALFDYASLCFEQSNGLFDITSGVLRRVWDFAIARVPDPAEVAAVLPLVGWDKVRWENRSIELPLAGMEIDLGGIGKEYAADKACAAALGAGIHHGFINLGGDVRIFGPRPDGSPWRIGVSHPRGGGVLTSLALSSGGIATSGDYERFFEWKGVRYSHILNPKTGYPVSGFQSVSVISESCLVSGSACTIAMLLGERGGEDFLEELGLPHIRVHASGEVRSSGLMLS